MKRTLYVPALILALLAFSASATTIRQASFSEYVSTASAIVRARVLTKEPVIPTQGIPYTEIALRVDAVLKGEATKGLLVRTPGAVKGDTAIQVASSPRFQEGEDVLLFLWRQPEDGVWVVLGMEFGAYRIQGAAKIDSESKTAEPTILGMHAQKGESPFSFENRIREELARQASEKK